MEGWSLNEGSGSLKKGSSMNAMRSARVGMGTPGGLGGGIKSSVRERESARFSCSFPTLLFFVQNVIGGRLSTSVRHSRDFWLKKKGCTTTRRRSGGAVASVGVLSVWLSLSSLCPVSG